MRSLRGIGLALAVLLVVAGCGKEQPQTGTLQGNRGAIGPGGKRAIKPDESKPLSTAKQP